MSRRQRLAALVFGDRLGLLLFLVVMLVYALFWRGGVFITDTYTVANGLVAVSEGHLDVRRAVYGPGLRTPGMISVDSVAYARNYGQIILALPFFLFLEALAAVADLRIALLAGWSLTLLAVVRLAGVSVSHERVANIGGSVLALSVFALLSMNATIIEPDRHYLLALQLQTMTAGALVGVVCYRLVSRIHGDRIGLVTGVAVSLSSPVGFWALFPKRHVLITLCVVVTGYTLYRSREGDGQSAQWFRALAYAPVGLVAWTNAQEGVILLAALLVVDFPTGGRDMRSLCLAWGSCLVSLLPMFLTNYLIAGNPLAPPRLISRYGADRLVQNGADGGDTGAGADGSTGASGSADSSESAFDVFADAIVETFVEGTAATVTGVNKLSETFVKSGYITRIVRLDDGQIRLSFLEAMPLSAVLVIVPVVLWRSHVWRRLRRLLANRTLTPVRTVDAFFLIYACCLTVVYLPRLPIHTSVTVRFLTALYPIVVYGLSRLATVREVVSNRFSLCAGSYVAGVLIVSQLLILYFFFTGVVQSEAVQTHARLNLIAAALVAGCGVAHSVGYRCDRLTAVTLGLAAAMSTNFLVLSAFWYFTYAGPYVIL